MLSAGEDGYHGHGAGARRWLAKLSRKAENKANSQSGSIES